MTTVTGFTAARMLAIENASVIDGSVVGDDLILERFDGTPINAGNVRGATGAPGVSQVEFDADVAAINSDIADINAAISAAHAAGAITNSQLADLSITNSKLADLSVSSAKIATSAVIESKIAASAVTSAKIANSAVGTEKVADDAITNAKLANVPGGSVGSVNYRLFSDMVFVFGLISQTTPQTLPVGYRPPNTIAVAGSTAGVFTGESERVEITAGGVITIESGGSLANFCAMYEVA